MLRLLLFLVVLLLPSLAHATTYYVQKTGSDSNNCTAAQSTSTPKLTIGSAIGCVGFFNASNDPAGATAGAGHTVEVRDATSQVYAEWFDYDNGNGLPGGTSWGAPFTLKATNAGMVTLRPTSGGCIQPTTGLTGKPCYNLSFWAQGYIIVDGINLDGLNVAKDNIVTVCDADAVTNCAHHIRIMNADVGNSFSNAFLISGKNVNTYIEWINLTVHNCGDRDTDYGGHNCFYITSNNNLVKDSNVYDNTGGGIVFYSSSGGNPCDNKAINNRVHDLRVDNEFLNGSVGIGMYGCRGLAIGNVVWNIDGTGINTEYGGSNSEIYNNTVSTIITKPGYNTPGTGIEVGVQSGSVIVKNNISWNNENEDVIVRSGGSATFDQNLCSTAAGTGASCEFTSNPLFTNAVSFDFTLQSGSPARDIGLNLCSVYTNLSYSCVDLVGTSRSSTIDLGAYEYIAGGGGGASGGMTETPAWSSHRRLPFRIF